MPVYLYRCARCGPFDQFKDSDHPAPACPGCAGESRRVFTAPAVRSTTGVPMGASATDRARIDRARAGEPSLTGAPTGSRLPSRPHVH
jgi:putative FmdB family regulatory protein